MDGTLAEREREIKEGFLPYTNLKELSKLCRDRNTTIRYYSDDIV